MVLGVLLDWTIRGSLWTMQGMYDGMSYLLYGEQEKKEDVIMRELQEMKKNSDEIKEQLALLIGAKGSEPESQEKNTGIQ
jgi:hypothetical protein